MTRTKLGLFAIPVIAAIMLSAGISTQMVAADPDGSNLQSAEIRRDLGFCVLFNGDGNFVLADSKMVVITQSGKGILKCQADVAPASDGKADVKKGFVCGTALGPTTNTHSVVSAAGKSTLICRV